MTHRTYDDRQLAEAVAAARSWRDVLRRLGLNATSAGSIRSVRRHADRLSLDHRHFTGQRRWSDAQLAAAVRDAHTWAEVVERLDLAGGSSASALRGHALRLALDTSHLGRRAPGPTAGLDLSPDLAHLSRAGSMWAATWFALAGYDVSWPLEPCRYDLVVQRRDVGSVRIQVKTSQARRDGSWVVMLSSSRLHASVRHAYDPDDIDYFFVVDGDLRCYLIPIAAVGGLAGASLSAYEQYRLPPLEAARAADHGSGRPLSACDAPADAG